MPLSKIHAPETLPDPLCRQIAEQLHRSLVDTCGVHPDDNAYLISKYAGGRMNVHPTFLGKRDVKATIIVEVTFLSGRTNDQKEALYEDFRNGLKHIGVPPQNAIVSLVENHPIDWSFSEAGSVKRVLGL